jgi:hypothetical protein
MLLDESISLHILHVSMAHILSSQQSHGLILSAEENSSDLNVT